MPKMYHTDSIDVLVNDEKLLEFVKASIREENKLWWESEKIPSQRHSLKVVGEDFEKRILESKKDFIVLMYHPNKNKNRKLLD